MISSTKQLPVVCILDRVQPSVLTGWIVTTIPAQPVPPVFALVDSVTVGLLECSLPRDDLIGTPYRADSGFHLELPKFIFDGRPHTLELRSPFGRDVPIPFIHEGRQKTRLTIQDIVRPIIHSMV